jgi:hypothetical protein
MAPIQLLLSFLPWPFFPYLPLPGSSTGTCREANTQPGRFWAFLQDLPLLALSLIVRIPFHQPPRMWVMTLCILFTMKAPVGSGETL